ncbi:MAG: PEP-CTERM sorting domain-containing protein [Candidatus Vogelbacteria bacterium]|nr:PEP-CTERM sorting domain-containing protein [Candidatus Vogelbacteria bacterium]
MARKMLVVLGVGAVLFGGLGANLARASSLGRVDASSGADRHSGNGWVGGDVMVDRREASFWTRGAGHPEPGNVGEWGINFILLGRFLENVPQPDIDFAIAHPMSSNGNRRVTTITWGDNFISFDPKFTADYSINTAVFSFSGGGGGGGGGLGKAALDNVPIPSPITWGYGSVYLNVAGGSILNNSAYLETYAEPNPFWNYDWIANFSFSGIIEAENFSVRAVPEPATAGLLAFGSLAALKRRRRVA